MAVSKSTVVDFIRLHRYGVIATIGADGAPNAALVSLVVDHRLDLFFDSFESTRKVANLRRDPRIGCAIGGTTIGDERTVQIDGLVDFPQGEELERFQRSYFQVQPDGRRRSKLPGVVYLRVRPIWVRYSDYNVTPPAITHFDASALEGPVGLATTRIAEA